MKKHLRALTGAVLFTLAPATLLAQSVPDEVDHVRYRGMLDVLQGRLDETREKLASLEAERASVRAEIERMTSDRTNLPARTSALNRDIQQRQERDRQLALEIADLNQTLERVAQDIARAERDLEALGAQWRDADQVRSRIDQDLRVLESQIANLQAQLDREIREERESLAQLERIERDIDRLQGRRQAMTQDLRDRQALHQAHQRELPQLKQQEAKLERQLQAAQAELKQSEDANTTAQATLKKLEADLASANQAVAPFQAKVDQSKKAVQASKAQLDALEKITTDAEANIKNMEERKAAAGQQMRTLEANRASQTSEVASASAALDAANIAASEATTKLQADKANLEAAQQAVREAIQQGRRADVPQLQATAKQLEEVLKASQATAAAATRSAAAARTLLAQKQDALKATVAQIETLTSFLGRVDGELAAERQKIAQNADAIRAKRQELQQNRQQLKTAEDELLAVSAERDRLAPLVQTARTAAAATQGRVAAMTEEVKRVRQERNQTERAIAKVQEAIAAFPQDVRQIENAITQNNREIQQRDGEAERERRLLSRIREDRVRVQQQLANLGSRAQATGQDLAQADRNARAAESIYRDREAQRDQLNLFAGNTRRSIEANQRTQAELRQSVDASRAEISRNDARLAQIERDFGAISQRSNQLNQEIPTVAQAIRSLEAQVATADGNYRSRLTLFQRYLTEATGLGDKRGASNGQIEGSKAGAANLSSTAARLGTATGSEEGRFEALLRAFVRGENEGFRTGRLQGLASAEDASRGSQEGTASGTREARDHAEQVLKPRYYAAEFERRLTDPTVSDEVVVKLAGLALLRAEKSRLEKTVIPPLTTAELALSRSTVTALDARIEAALKELGRIRDEQARLRVAANVYLAPTAIAIPVDGKTCEGVYKNVSDFVAACQASYKLAFEAKFKDQHKSEFMAGYTAAFSAVTERERESVIQREFAANYKEGEAVARAVGLALGKEEVYQERFAEARARAYETTLSQEDRRVSAEAIALVDQRFATSGVVSQKELAAFSSGDKYGITPGAGLSLDLVLRNAGLAATAEGAVKVRILEASANLKSERSVALVKSLPARKIVRTAADFGFKVSDTATPGERVRLVAEISYPGHDYTAARTERIELEEMVGVSPAATLALEYTEAPQVANAFGILRSLNLAVTIGAQFRGLDKPYSVSLEEVGTNWVNFSFSGRDTKVLGQGESDRIVMGYKISKSARGKEVKLKLVARYGNVVVEERLVTLKPR